MKIHLFLLVLLAVAGLHAQNAPVILPTDDPETPEDLQLIWDAKPGVRYEVQATDDLSEPFVPVEGYPIRSFAPMMQLPVDTSPGSGFYRIVALDEQAPEITTRFPKKNDYAIPRFSTVTVQLEDATGIDPASISMDVGGLGTFTLSDPELTFSENTLTFDNGGDVALGAFGEEITIALSVADTVGNSAAYAWSFRLEVEPDMVEDLFMFGSPEAQRSGQQVGAIPTRVLAEQQAGGPIRMASGADPWSIESVLPDRIVILYEGATAPSFAVDSYLANMTPATLDEIFYRKVTGTSDNSADKQLTIFTTDVPLTEVVEEGTFSTSSDTPAFRVDEDGVIQSTAPASSSKLSRSFIGEEEIDLDTELTLKNSEGLNILRLTLRNSKAVISNANLETRVDKVLDAITRMDVYLDGDIEVFVDVEAEVLEVGIVEEWPVVKLPLVKSIHPLAPGVFTVSDISVDVKAEGKLTAAGIFGFGYRQRGRMNNLGFTYDSKYLVSWTPWWEDDLAVATDVDFEETEFLPFTGNFEGEAGLKLKVGLITTTLVYGLGGPEIVLVGAETGPVGKFDGYGDIKASLDSEVYSEISLVGKFFEFIDLTEVSFKKIWWEHSKPLYASDLGDGILDFLRHPQSQTVGAGSSAYLQCSVNDPDNVNYQWLHNNIPLHGETSSRLKLAKVGMFNAGNYRVKVTEGGETVHSETASLGVVPDDCDYADSYPYSGEDPNEADPWLFFYRECTSYVAWKMNDVSRDPFSNYMLDGHFGNASNWDDNAEAIGFEVSHLPTVGAIAHWDAGEGLGSLGHVAFVESVNSDGTVNVTEYNQQGNHSFGVRCGIDAPRYIHVVSDPSVSAPTSGDMVRVVGGTLPEKNNNGMGTLNVDTFYIGRYEVTWGEWQTVQIWGQANGYEWKGADEDSNGAYPAGCADDHPVQAVSWYDVIKWCNAKSEHEGLTPIYTYNGSTYKSGEPSHTSISQNLSANGYRLPQEVEWEFAARGGNQTNGYTYAGSNDLNAVGWYYDNSGGAVCDLYEGRGTWPVGEKAANELGLYDMSGNVREWCWDQNRSYRRLRGGSWGNGTTDCIVSYRFSYGNPDFRNNIFGFRIARTPSP